jgi:asparagine synthase (glutamine-hydrolysing)
MCGLAGAINEGARVVTEMLSRIQHRGPDGQGVKEHGAVIHGHVRLALIDLSAASSQPFVRASTTLTFNGEIWNHSDLRAELKAAGAEFLTSGDTEVLAAMLERYGLECLPRLDGMFAFVWSDAKNNHWIVRDAFGKIPIYLAKTKNGYLWASERKSFPSGLRPIAVPPGHAFNLVTGEWRCWYQLPCATSMDASRLLEHLRSGVRKRLAADAPVCCLISGGLDSSIVLALAKEISNDVTAYTAVHSNRSTDLLSARRICSELGIKLVEVEAAFSRDIISDALYSIEIASKAQIEIAALCIPLARRIYADGFRACLSGEAADELFGGYGNFCIKASKASNAEVIALRQAQLSKMARGNFVRCNKAFMSAGVECRLPFMEQSLVESAIQLSRTSSPLGKGLLKAAARSILPSWVINRQKDTFQGGSGMSATVASHVANPTIFYNTELRKAFGYLPKD